MSSKVLRVASGSHPYLVAGAIAGQMRENGCSQTQAIGTNAVYRMLKAVIIAQQYVTDDGMHLAFVPEFVGIIVDNQDRTAVRLNICTQMPGTRSE
jgi:stage V sporulation protein S